MVAHQGNNLELESKDKLKHTPVSPDTPKHGVRSLVKVLNFETARTADQTEPLDPRLGVVFYRRLSGEWRTLSRQRGSTTAFRLIRVEPSPRSVRAERVKLSLWVSVPPSRTRQSRHFFLSDASVRLLRLASLTGTNRLSCCSQTFVSLETWPNYW